MATRPQANLHMSGGPGHDAPAYEPESASVKGVVIFMVALALVGIGVHLALALLLGVFQADENRRHDPPSPLAVKELPPGPRLQPHPEQDLAAMRIEEKAVLESTGWVDAPAGVVRVPIEIAMQMLAQGRTFATTAPTEARPAAITPPQGQEFKP